MKLTERELAESAGDALKACLAEVPFLRVLEIVRETRIAPDSPDLVVEVETPEGRQLLVVEVRVGGQPRIARAAVNQILRYKAALPDAYGIFLAPYVSSAAAEICTREGIGYVDLAGNCRLSFDRVYIRREGNPNPFSEKRDLRSLYASRASRVLRVLLLNPDKRWKLQNLAAEAEVSLGQVYNVKERLADREWISTTGGVRLNSPEQLLAKWAESYDCGKSPSRDFYTLKSTNEIEYDLAETCRLKGIRYALTGFSGAARYAPFVRYQRASAYVDEIGDELIESLRLKPVTSGANLSLLLPYDEGVYYGTRTFTGVDVVSPVQAYLDVRGVPGRGEEAADALMREVIGPLWKQVG